MRPATDKLNYKILPPKRFASFNFSEIWRYRELFYIFVWRDIKVRYKQTAFGVLWAILQPFLSMVVFTFFFGRLAKMPSDGIPYPIFVYSGLLFWNYFASSVTSSSDSLISNEGIIKKVYFPRLILPLSTCFTPIIDFFIALLVLFGLMVFYKFTPPFLGIIFIPVLIFVSLLGAAGLGIFLTSINVRYRDVRYILPFFIQILLFLTPVIYPISIVPAKLQWVIFINPMAGVISLERSLLLRTSPADWRLLGISLVSGLILLVIGVFYFRKTEKSFADIL